MGDAPLVGSGLFCDGAIGAAVCTGDGEEIMRTCLAFRKSLSISLYLYSVVIILHIE